MTNAEKYIDELWDIILRSFGVVKQTTCGEYSATDMALDLPMISWEDSVPWLVKDLKALLVVYEY